MRDPFAVGHGADVVPESGDALLQDWERELVEEFNLLVAVVN